MDLGLTDRRALVTGSSSGLGAAIAEYLAPEGATVVVHGRDADRVRAVVDRVVAAGGRAESALGDLATDEGADAVAAAAGHVDVLVNNAGAYDYLSWSDADAATWTRTYEVNVVSGVRMIHRLVPGMRERGWGRVVTIGGGLAVEPMAMQPHYNATLAARHNLAVSLARELGGTGITSNVVAPGLTVVDSARTWLLDNAAERGWGEAWEDIEAAASRELTPNDVGRLGRPEEIAAAVAYLCGPQAAYVSGATLRVDGGQRRSVQ